MSRKVNFARINDYYDQKSIFITGVTGLIGKVLLYKILLSINEVKNIYVLIRDKNNKGINERFNDLVNKSRGLFDGIESEMLEKIILINGDLTKVGLDLSETDRNEIIENVSLVFHCAANVSFDAKLRGQLLINVGGTNEIIDLCRQLKQLEAFVYLSTVYSNPHQRIVGEKIYPSLQNPIELLEIARNSNQEICTDNYPNNYVFTKNLAETLIDNEFKRNHFPAIIVRPGIVTTSYRQPFSGWFPTVNSISGMLLIIGVGLGRIFRSKRHISFDMIPVDFVANTCIAAAYDLSKPNSSKENIVVYNCNSASVGSLTFGEFEDHFYGLFLKYPNLSTIRPPKTAIYNYYLLPLCLLQFIEETCFAYVCDFVLLLIGRKPIAVKKVSLYQRLMGLIQPFVGRQWYFINYNMLRLSRSLSGSDRLNFDCDIESIDWYEYVRHMYFMGSKLFLKETDESLKKAKITIK